MIATPSRFLSNSKEQFPLSEHVKNRSFPPKKEGTIGENKYLYSI